MNYYIGSHISLHQFVKSNNPYIQAIKYITKYGGNIVQFMLTLNKQFIDKKLFADCKKYIRQYNIKIIVHASYIYNIAQDWDKYSPWISSLKKEIKCAYKMGANYIVLHFGKYKTMDKKQACNNMFTSLVYIHNITLKYKKVKILLETPAGQGTEMCYLFDDLVYFYDKFKKSSNIELKDRIKLCIDTCHIFAAGNDITNYLNKFQKYIGFDHLKLVHLNDSYGKFGGRIDRHQNIGKGYIGKDMLLQVSKICIDNNIPIILETPNNGLINEIPLIANYIKAIK